MTACRESRRLIVATLARRRRNARRTCRRFAVGNAAGMRGLFSFGISTLGREKDNIHGEARQSELGHPGRPYKGVRKDADDGAGGHKGLVRDPSPNTWSHEDREEDQDREPIADHRLADEIGRAC